MWISRYLIRDVAVNERNPLSKGMGFEVYKGIVRDEQGNPYPLLYIN